MAIPAFINRAARHSADALAALEAAAIYDITMLEPTEVGAAVRAAVASGADRVLIAGGDGSISAAASVVAGTDVSLVVLPAGTLNHFARDVGLPADLRLAAEAGTSPRIRVVDVGYVNDRLFLNTSSVGAYVIFVHVREELERRFGYRIASLLAALRMLGRVRPFRVEMELAQALYRARTSLLFVGVGERELRVPVLGGRVTDGKRGLHVMSARGGTVARLLALGLQAVARGIRVVRRRELLDAFITDFARIDLARAWGRVAIDGELVRMQAPLEYRLGRDALRIVVPEE